MTANPRPRSRAVPTGGPRSERELIRRMTAMLLDFSTKRGHLAMRVPQEGMGVCTGRHDGTCAPSCIEWGALLEAGADYLERANRSERQVAQIEMFESEVAG